MTVAALGDGGLFLALPELDTAARAGAQLLIVVYDDAAYGAEVHHFAPLGHDDRRSSASPTPTSRPRRGRRRRRVTVRHVDDLAPVAAGCAAAPGPLLVDAKVDPHICADWLAEAFRAG